jgi:hypothetical protein
VLDRKLGIVEWHLKNAPWPSNRKLST